MALNPTWANKILDNLTGKAAWTSPTNLYISAHTGDPGATGASEHGGTAAYARIETDAADWDAAAAGHIQNTNVLSHPMATAAYSANITHFGIWDHATNTTAANFVGGGALTAPKTVGENDTLKYAVGDIDITLT